MNPHFYEELNFPQFPGYRPFIALNMVSSLDGKITVGGQLKPGSLGSTFDRQTMNVLRSHFDGILAGGNTIRQHPYYLGVPKELELQRVKKGLARQPLTILMTKTGNLDPTSPLFSAPPKLPLILTTFEGERNLPFLIKERSSVEVLDSTTNLQETLALLTQKYGIKKLLLEGGPSVNFQFLQAKLVDEIFITLAPKLIGNRSDLTMVMGEAVLPEPRHITLLSSFQKGQELYLRYGLDWT